jgi:hypothetical protein
MSNSDDLSSMDAIGLLNRILEGSDPQDTIRIPLRQAKLLATLGLRDLGALSRAIKNEGVVCAMEHRGLFSRQVTIVPDDAPDFSIEGDEMRLRVGNVPPLQAAG